MENNVSKFQWVMKTILTLLEHDNLDKKNNTIPIKNKTHF